MVCSSLSFFFLLASRISLLAYYRTVAVGACGVSEGSIWTLKLRGARTLNGSQRTVENPPETLPSRAVKKNVTRIKDEPNRGRVFHYPGVPFAPIGTASSPNIAQLFQFCMRSEFSPAEKTRREGPSTMTGASAV